MYYINFNTLTICMYLCQKAVSGPLFTISKCSNYNAHNSLSLWIGQCQQNTQQAYDVVFHLKQA